MDKGSKDVITLKVDDNKGTVIYEEKTKNYVWFIKIFIFISFLKIRTRRKFSFAIAIESFLLKILAIPQKYDNILNMNKIHKGC